MGDPMGPLGITMEGRPKNVIAASALGTIGGIVAIASMVNGFESNINNIFWGVGLGLLIAVLFFAGAGYLYSGAKGNYPSLLAILGINAVAVIVGIAIKTISIPFGIALIIILVLFCLLISSNRTERWMETDRV